jgi:hypothetical protein
MVVAQCKLSNVSTLSQEMVPSLGSVLSIPLHLVICFFAYLSKKEQISWLSYFCEEGDYIVIQKQLAQLKIIFKKSTLHKF